MKKRHARLAAVPNWANVHVAAQPVELGDEQPGTRLWDGGNKGREWRPLVFLAALHFHILAQPVCRIWHELPDSGRLCFEAQARHALLLVGNTIVDNVAAMGRADEKKEYKAGLAQS